MCERLQKNPNIITSRKVWISTYLFPNQSGVIDTYDKRDESRKRDVITVKRVMSV